MQVASLPTVFAVSGKKLADSFVGLLPPAQLNAFISKLLEKFARTPVFLRCAHTANSCNDIDAFSILNGAASAPEAEDGQSTIQEAEADLENGDISTAAAKFSEAMQKDKDSTHLAYAGLGNLPALFEVRTTSIDFLALHFSARCALEENNLEAAQHLVKELKVNITFLLPKNKTTHTIGGRRNSRTS